MWTKRGGLATPVPMHMGGAESKAVVKKGGVDNGPALRPLQEVTQVTQVSVTTPHAVPGAVLIQDKHLAWAEPTLHNHTSTEEGTMSPPASRGSSRSGRQLTRQQKVSLSLWSNVSRCTISKSEAWSKLQGLAEINSSMPCFWALSASSGGQWHRGKNTVQRRGHQWGAVYDSKSPSQHRNYQGCFFFM